MASIRQGYLDDYSQQNQNVGIGTSIPKEKLEIHGGVTSKDLSVTGIATITSASGFIRTNLEYVENVNLDAGDSGTLSDEIIVGAGLTMTVGTGATAGQGNIDSLKVYKMFQPPSGTTNQRPVGKPGSLFYNFDFKTVEFFDGNSWNQVNNTTASGRAALFGGNHNPASASISTIGAFNITVGGEEAIFGDLTQVQNASTGLGNRTRGIIVMGKGSTPDAIEYVNMASLGNSITFGDTNTVAYRTGGASSSSTRGVVFGGRGAPGNPHVNIQYLEINTLGNALDFGDLVINGRGQGCNIGSPIRGFCVANAPSAADIQFINISSKGNAILFGDNIYGGAYQAGCSNSVRGVIAGGYQFPGSFLSNQKSYITMASEGNAVEFGDLTESGNDGLGYAFSAATSTRGVVMGGMDSSPSPTPSRSTVDAFNFNSKGEVTAIGDLSEGKRDGGCNSDSHGGLGGF